MNILKRYRPAFFDGFEKEEDEFDDLKSLMAISWLEGFQHKNFSHFARSGKRLMAFYKNGTEWWVAGICVNGDLPEELPVAVYPKTQ